MPRLNPIDPERAQGKAKTLLDGVRKALGTTPNIMRTMAHSPAALDAYLSFGKALGGGSLGAKMRERIALAVSNANGCRYCTSAHTAVGKMLGLDEKELAMNLRASSADPRVEAALRFARDIVVNLGWMSDQDVQRVRDAGYGDGEIVEIVATVAHTTFTNYFNHIAQTEVDFPVVEPDERLAA